MKVDLDDKKVIARWQHEVKETSLPGGRTVKRHITTCIIQPVSHNKNEVVEPIVKACAGCHSKDTYSKNRGRILSLTKALKELWPHSTPTIALPTNREIRKRFWKEYSNMRHGIVA